MGYQIQVDLEHWQAHALECAYQLRIWPDDEELLYLRLSEDEVLVCSER